MQVATSLNSALANYDNKTVTATKYYNKTEIDTKNSYSTNEIDTGKTWIDGKKIYRKVCTSLDTTGSQQSNWYTTGVTIPNIETLIDVTALRTPYKSVMKAINFQLSGETIEYYISGYTVNPIDKLIVEYTKTTN